MRQEIAQEAMKASPPAVITGWAWLNGMTLEKWVAVATLVYIGLQAAHLLWRWFREIRGKK